MWQVELMMLIDMVNHHDHDPRLWILCQKESDFNKKEQPIHLSLYKTFLLLLDVIIIDIYKWQDATYMIIRTATFVMKSSSWTILAIFTIKGLNCRQHGQIGIIVQRHLWPNCGMRRAYCLPNLIHPCWNSHKRRVMILGERRYLSQLEIFAIKYKIQR